MANLSYALNTDLSSNQHKKSSNDYNIDPFEKYNRNAFRMNMKLDSAIIKPVTIWYTENVPDPAQALTNNFFDNLRDFVTLGNDVLQLKVRDSLSTFMRVVINSIIGMFGIIDVSTSIGLPSHENNFGTTMKFYGWKNSSYFVIPLMGPSTIRDAIGLIPNIYFNPTWYILNNNYISLGLFGVNAIDRRSKYLNADKILSASLDPYITMRDFYLQSTTKSSEVPAHNDSDITIDDLLKEESK